MIKIERINGELQASRGDNVILTERGLVANLPIVSHSLSSKADESSSFTPLAKSNTHNKLILPSANDSVAIAAKASPAKLESVSIDEIKSAKEDNPATLDLIMQEIREGSITPTTFAYREFENSLDDFYYQDRYQYRGNEVVRFGINAWALPDPASLSNIDIEPIAPSDSASETSSTRESNPSASRKSHSSQGKKPVLLPKYYTLEIELLQKAITFLLEHEDHKTVVVDIFAQEAGELKIDKFSGQLETHAILLYKNPPVTASVATENEETKLGALKDDSLAMTEISRHEIVVIDPSNSAYSAHLANLTKTHIIHPEFEKISTLKKSMQIYTIPTGAKTGHEFDQYRDCIDIAIKMGFGLNKTDTVLTINIYDSAQFKKLDQIRKITNQLKLDDNIIDPTLTNRIKQTSDIKLVEAFNELEMVIKHNLNEVLKRFPANYDVIYDFHHQILTGQYSSKMILGELLNCNTACLEVFSEEHNSLVELVKAIDTPVELGGVS